MLLFFLISLISLNFAISQNNVNYYNTLIKWERRELTCESSKDGKTPGPCLLYYKNDSVGVPAKCRLITNSRQSCDIDCKGADRDSVISKTPNNNHKCVRFYSYNSEIEQLTGKWNMWRSDACMLEKISLEVHCGFP
uniref:Secreted protein n=1 Tax=Panagrolaimus sp. PS1159 TaxID=55785 RepID=A0AC35FZ52_9BILA